MEFLTEIHKTGCSYSKVNTFKSALAFVLHFKEEDSLLIQKFLKGVYNRRPPGPKYNTTWDPDPVLQHLATLYPLESLTLRQLTLKVVTRMALISGQRLQTLSKIRIQDIRRLNSSLHIFVADKLKTSGKNRSQPVMVLPFFSGEARPLPCVDTFGLYTKNRSTAVKRGVTGNSQDLSIQHHRRPSATG